MIKTIEFGDKKVQFSTNFAWCFIYKSQFGKDPAQIIMPAARVINDESDGGTDLSKQQDLGYRVFDLLGFTGIADIAWSMAKLVDKTIPEPTEWAMSFGDDFDLTALVTELIPEAITSCLTSKKSKVPIPAAGKTEPKSTSN